MLNKVYGKMLMQSGYWIEHPAGYRISNLISDQTPDIKENIAYDVLPDRIQN